MMRHLTLLLMAIVTVGYLVKTAAAEEKPIPQPNARFVEAFEHVPPDVPGFQPVTTQEHPHSGKTALLVSYHWPAKDPNPIFAPLLYRLPGKPVRLRLWVLGDASRSSLSLRLWDSFPRGRETDEYTLAPLVIDWKGWKLLEWNLPHSAREPAEKLVPGKAIVDYPLFIAGMHLAPPALKELPKEPLVGRIVLDDMEIETILPEERMVQLSLVPDKTRCALDEKLTGSLTATNLGLATDRTAHIKLAATDALQKPLYAAEQDVTLGPGESTSTGFEIEPRGAIGPIELSASASGQSVKASARVGVALETHRAALETFEGWTAWTLQEGENAATELKRKEGAAHRGKWAVELGFDFQKGRGAVIETEEPLPGTPLRLEMWVHGDESGALFAPSFHDRGPSNNPEQPFDEFCAPGFLAGRCFKRPQCLQEVPAIRPVCINWSGWRRVSFDCPGEGRIIRKAQSPEPYLLEYPLSFSALVLVPGPGGQATGRIALDDVSVVTQLGPEEDSSVRFLSAHASSCTLPGEPVRFEVESREMGPACRLSGKAEIVDYAGGILYSHDAAIEMPPCRDDLQTAEVDFGPLDLVEGVYHAHFHLKTGGSTFLAAGCNSAAFVRITLPEGCDGPDKLDEWLKVPELMARHGQLRNTVLFFEWDRVQPRNGVFDWKAIDPLVAHQQRLRMNVSGRLGYSALWASETGFYDPVESTWYGSVFSLPKTRLLWECYVNETVRRYGERIHYWEVWHEPDTAETLQGGAKEYVEKLLLPAVEAIRRVDPEAKVVLGGVSIKGMIDFVRSAFEAGAGKLVHVIAVRPYTYPESPERGYLDEMLREERKLLKELGAKQSLWITGAGWPTGSAGGAVSEREQADYLARELVYARIFDVERCLPDLLNETEMRDGVGLIYRLALPAPAETNRIGEHYAFKPAFFAVKTAQCMLDGLSFWGAAAPNDRDPDISRAFVFSGKGETIATLWRLEGESVMRLPAGIPLPQLLDTMGREMSVGEQTRQVRITASVRYLRWTGVVPDSAAAFIQAAPVEFQDARSSLWKGQPILVVNVGFPAGEAACGYEVAGERQDAEVEGAGVNLFSERHRGCRYRGTESFEIDLSKSKPRHLLVRRRVSFGPDDQTWKVLIDGKEIGLWTVGPEDGLHRFHRSTFLVPGHLLPEKPRFRITFEPTGGEAISLGFSVHPVQADELFLSDLEPEMARQGWGWLRNDQNCLRNPLELLERKATKGLGTHAPSEIVYRLNGSFSKFKALVGVDQNGSHGTVGFRVLADDRQVAETKVFDAFTPPQAIEVSIVGANKLTLITTDGNDGLREDFADWSEAKLIITGTTESGKPSPKGAGQPWPDQER